MGKKKGGGAAPPPPAGGSQGKKAEEDSEEEGDPELGGLFEDELDITVSTISFLVPAPSHHATVPASRPCMPHEPPSNPAAFPIGKGGTQGGGRT